MPTLNITFPAVVPTPSLGYRIKYWPTSNPSDVITAITPTNLLVVTGLPGSSYTGTVEASCGGGTYGSPRTFTTAL
jgi:hypothetical protein